jgi:hypothetical protein
MARTRRHTNLDPLPVDRTEADDRPGPEEAGQAGDTQGLSGLPEATSESVRELAEEGQFFEAAIASGIEDAPDADVAEVKTREVPADDVPDEYLERDPDSPKGG